MKRALQIIGVVILCLASSLADPTTNAAMVIVIGEVSVNGNALTRSSAIFDGDRIRTGASAALVLHVRGSSIRIGPTSELRYRGTALEFFSGTAEVHGRETIVSGTVTIAPLRESAFTIQRASTRTSLHLLSGTLKLSRGKESSTIAAPAEYAIQDDQLIPAAKAGARAHTLPVAAGSAAGASVVVSHWLTSEESRSAASCVSGKSPTSCK